MEFAKRRRMFELEVKPLAPRDIPAKDMDLVE